MKRGSRAVRPRTLKEETVLRGTASASSDIAEHSIAVSGVLDPTTNRILQFAKQETQTNGVERGEKEETAASVYHRKSTAVVTAAATADPERLLEETLRQLKDQYTSVLEDHQISTIAKYESLRQTLTWSGCALVVVVTVGTWMIQRNGLVSEEEEEGLHERDTVSRTAKAALFTAYTLSSAGFGTVDISHTPGVLWFVMGYLFVGISLVQLMVTQLIQYAELELARWSQTHEKADAAATGLRALEEILFEDLTGRYSLSFDYQKRLELIHGLKLEKTLSSRIDVTSPSSPTTIRAGASADDDHPELHPKPNVLSRRSSFSRIRSGRKYNWRRMVTFIYGNKLLLPLFILFYFAVLLSIGSIVMMYLEGWTVMEAIYFSVSCMMTLGYGDLAPTTTASTWFVVVWLPLNISFLTIFSRSVSHVYFAVSEWNVNRIERQLVRKKETGVVVPKKDD